ncbi:MAG: GNAT family N-acetyltransferase [Sulfuritalea sp.]|nr:GNAT family N-acetyltransferase [Sulfuritalea sp.]
MSARQSWHEATLRISLRLAAADDRERVARFLAAMDGAGLYQRHFAHGAAPNLALLARLAAIDGLDRAALLATGRDGEVLGHAEYVASGGNADYALMVLPALRGLGLGRRLLAALLQLAAAAGQLRMNGMIQAGNAPALGLASQLGFGVVPGADRTTVIVSRELVPALVPVTDGTCIGATPYSILPRINDPDRTPLHSRPGPRTSFRSRCGQVQCVAADPLGSR